MVSVAAEFIRKEETFQNLQESTGIFVHFLIWRALIWLLHFHLILKQVTKIQTSFNTQHCNFVFAKSTILVANKAHKKSECPCDSSGSRSFQFVCSSTSRANKSLLVGKGEVKHWRMKDWLTRRLQN